jgi:hypothetical protein
MTRSDTTLPTTGLRNQSTVKGIQMRNHRLGTLLSAAAIATAGGSGGRILGPRRGPNHQTGERQQ